MNKFWIACGLSVVIILTSAAAADQVDDLIGQLKNPDTLVQCQAIEQLGRLKDKRAVEPLIALIWPEQTGSSQPDTQIKSSPADPVTEKVEKARSACAGGDKHTPAAITTDAATLKKLIANVRMARMPSDKANAIEALGAAKDKRAVDILLPLLNEQDLGQLHSKVIIALGQIGDPKAVPLLLKRFETESPFIRKDIAAALAQIGDPRAIEPLYRAMTTDSFLKTQGAQALANLGSANAVKYLNKAAQSEDVFVKKEAQKALDSLGADHGLAPLVDLLKDSDPKVRAMAAKTLADIGDSTVQLDLQEAMTGLDEQTRNAIRQKLTQNETNQAAAMSDTAFQANVRVAAIEALEQIADPKAARPLLAALQDQDDMVCKAAGKALAAYNSKTVIRPIEITLNTKNNTVIKQAIKDLGWIGSDYAVELIGKYINNPFTNHQAIEALGHTGNPKAIPYLQQAMQSVYSEDKAMEAIMQINHPDAIKLLIKGLSANSFVARQKAVEGLGKVNDPSVIDPLIELFKKNDHTVQDKVIEVLKKYDDPRISTAFAEALTDPFQKDKFLAILKERNWQPQTTRQKVIYYMACEDWDQCAQLGPEGADLLLAELKEKCSSGVAKALNKMQDARAYPVMLDCVKKWRGSPELLAGAEKTGWKPQTTEERLIVALIKQDKTALKKLWDESQGKEAFMQALNSENISAVTSMMHISVRMGLEEMVSPMITRLNSMKNDTMAVRTANLFLNSGTPALRTAAESWAKNNGYEVRQFGFAHGPGWGKW